MPLKIFNTFSRNKDEFQPLDPPKVKMYVCGITAYDYCHLGHARASVVFDMVYRYLRHKGYQVEYVRNFTDIDDKIINRANESGQDWKTVTEKFIHAFQEDMQSLGNLSPTQEPRATEYIQGMQNLISQLIDNGMAYQADGDVFYAVRKFKSYGKLAHKNIEELSSGARVEVRESKHDPLDFALWKGAKPGEPSWESPWGAGRPGWHIECSTMSTDLLGPTIDIHGGGRDLTFPHHENERAQSEGAYQKPFARYWMHNGFVQLNADKMSKSTGNFLTIRDVLKKFPSQAVRYFLLSSHYRSPLDFNEDNMREALAAVERIYQTLLRLEEFEPKVGGGVPDKISRPFLKQLESFPQDFEKVMDDDFNTAQALGICFELIRELNKFLDAGPNPGQLDKTRPKVKAHFKLVADCLGLFQEDPKAFMEARKRLALAETSLSPEAIEQKIQARLEARSRKDFSTADQIRDELAEQGILLKDNPDGSTGWTVK